MHKYWLWTDRMNWISKKHKFKGCLFCRIIKGDKKIPSKVLHKGGDVMVMMNLFPYNTGHLQVIPIRHVVSLDELTDAECDRLFGMVRKCVKLIKKALNPLGFNIGMNIGDVSGASIDHLHVHIVPRYKTDFGFMEIIAETKTMPETVEKTYKKLMKHSKILEK